MHQHAAQMDQLTADGIVFHKSCFKCNHCKGTLTVLLFTSVCRSMDDAVELIFELLLHSNYSCEHLPGGREVHCNVIKTRQINSVLRATFVDFYTKCGELKSTVMLHDECQVKSSTIWSIMMWGLIQNDEFLEAVNVFERMQKSVIKPCKDALRALVATYTNLGALLLGRRVHNLM
ncbi:hypothetical protein ZIOFF_071189 [Zingiber officinale]|uniref:Uncharacterized protein n=1 Tax=Zingiber officinale TaxID=94328 RepID=A0A8J5EBA3_ZINOF|nr:hypothetical protein ZIOFF_071189 [Zingiber officinale]